MKLPQSACETPISTDLKMERARQSFEKPSAIFSIDVKHVDYLTAFSSDSVIPGDGESRSNITGMVALESAPSLDVGSRSLGSLPSNINHQVSSDFRDPKKLAPTSKKISSLKRSWLSLYRKMKGLGLSRSHDHMSSTATTSASSPQLQSIQKSAQMDSVEYQQVQPRHRQSPTLFAVPLKDCPASTSIMTTTPKTPRARYPSISTPNMNRVPQSFKPIALQPVGAAIIKMNGTPNASKDDLRRSAYLNNNPSMANNIAGSVYVSGNVTPAASSIHDLSASKQSILSQSKMSAHKQSMTTTNSAGLKKLKLSAFSRRSVSANSILSHGDVRKSASKHSFIQSLLGINRPAAQTNTHSIQASGDRMRGNSNIPIFSSDSINNEPSAKHEVDKSAQVLESTLYSASSQNIALANSTSSLNRRKSTVKETFNINQTSSSQTPELSKIIKEKLNLDSIEFMINQYAVIKDIGQGSFSKVMLVYNMDDGRYYACKGISKRRLRKMNLWKNGPQRANKSPSKPPAPTADITHQSEPSSTCTSPTVSATSSATNEEKKKRIDHMDLVRHEIAILKRLSRHPHILTLTEVLDDQKSDSLYMIFELCEFGNIMKLKIGETVPCFTEDLARRYFRGIVLGLEYLHFSGVVHRDIKPENILLTAQNQAVVGDFSISYCTDVVQRSANGLSIDVPPPPAEQGNNLLTPMFTPPEFTTMTTEAERTYTAASDIWSLGITLYCFVHGHLPFETLELDGLFENIRSGPIEKSPELTNSLKNLLDRLLERDPKRRIDLAAIKSHAWVTRNGKDPMPTKEENCIMLLGDETAVETITQEELDQAVTPAVKLLDRIKERMKQAGYPHQSGKTSSKIRS